MLFGSCGCVFTALVVNLLELKPELQANIGTVVLLIVAIVLSEILFAKITKQFYSFEAAIIFK